MGKYLVLIGCFLLVGCGDKPSPQTSTASAPNDYHDDSQTTKSNPDIDKLVASIPNLKQGLKESHLQVEKIEHGQYTADDIKLSHGEIKKGDISYNFYTSAPSDKLPCPLLRTFMIDKRGEQWFPRNKTANYLMTGNCSLPPEN
nr:hypothetical protein [Moraxella sp. CTOTU47616]